MFELLNLAVFSDFYRFAATQPQFTDICLCFRHEDPLICLAIMLRSLSFQGCREIILGDPGADSGGEGKPKRVEKYRTKKSKERREEPLGTMSY